MIWVYGSTDSTVTRKHEVSITPSVHPLQPSDVSQSISPPVSGISPASPPALSCLSAAVPAPAPASEGNVRADWDFFLSAQPRDRTGICRQGSDGQAARLDTGQAPDAFVQHVYERLNDNASRMPSFCQDCVNHIVHVDP